MNPIRADNRVDIGADVMDSGGNKVGTATYIVVRPPEMQMTDIVVSTGAILGRDVVVPLHSVREVAEGKVYLSIDQDQLKTYPDYIEINYQQPPGGWVPPAGPYYPATGVLWPVGASYPEASSVRVNTPPGTVGISEGKEVESSDGKKVGSVDALETDPMSNEVTGFVVKRGFLFTHDTLLPTTAVSAVHDGKVILDVTKDQVQDLESSHGRRGT